MTLSGLVRIFGTLWRLPADHLRIKHTIRHFGLFGPLPKAILLEPFSCNQDSHAVRASAPQLGILY